MLQGITVQKRKNLFITNEEASLLWKHARDISYKLQVLVGFMLFRGFRLSEACSINLYDFKNDKFNEVDAILCKSHLIDSFPIIKEFSVVLKDYIKKNMHTFKNGWLFPQYNGGSSHWSRYTASTLIGRLRKHLIDLGHLNFMDSYDRKDGKQLHRVSAHSMRRWYETTIFSKTKDIQFLRDVMRYSSTKVCDVYLNPFETWKQERQKLEGVFENLFDDFRGFEKNQTKLTSF